MKLFQQLLVAPAALGLLAPLASDSMRPASATELNIDGVSEYTAKPRKARSSSSLDQVTSITQFSDVYPTDWAYQALSNLIERYGCVAGYPNGTYRGNRAMTRFEAAALLNACLDRVTEVTDELKRLMKEFEKELAILKGRVDGLEARVGELESTQFSTTTKLKGQTTFVTGAVTAGGDNGSKYIYDTSATYFSDSDGTIKEVGKVQRSNRNTVFNKNGTQGGANAYNRNYGAFTFNYDQRLKLNTSFTGKDLLVARLRTGNFTKSGNGNAFGGSGVNLTALDIATDSGVQDEKANIVTLDRLFYKFPVGKEFTVIAGALARNTESIALWPSVYNKGASKILDWTALMGTSGVYNKETGQLVGAYWKQKVDKGQNAFSVSVNYVADDGDGNETDPTKGGFMTSNSQASFLAQIGYAGPQWGVAFGYRYGQCDSGNGYRRGTSFAKTGNWNNECSYQPRENVTINGTEYNVPKGSVNSDGDYVLDAAKRSGASTNSYALNAYWQPENSGFIPSISVGWGINQNTTENKIGGSPVSSQSWMVGLKWDDVFLKGNDLGFGFGQPVFATGLEGCEGKRSDERQACGDTPFDGNYVFELFYNFQVTDNIKVTPAIFYLSRPMGQNTRRLVENGTGYDGQFNVFGGLIQTTFKF
ncbi:outer membrane porin [Synechococcus sp. MEDNS5]|uniref:iron uptake porin n=1 Tax=Synechococcus sp. MEDNS5 TaxID=1442554 RepID=UPI0016492610|nr:iron uptake porin [Synechococcus sp. MEDNS5]QNJ07159.1 outer membrane porin [Synechococcus sp. MEDNS5]